MWGAIIGSLIAAGASYNSSRSQMNHQADQTGTAWQRGVADMKRAGINPILAAQSGGAQSSAGAQANFPDVGATSNTAQMVKIAKAKQKSEIDLNKANANKANADAKYSRGLHSLFI